jgi:holliday junction DNA helicase RuvA
MIGCIEGKIFEVGYVSKQIYIVVLTSGGVGYEVFVPSSGVYNVDEKVSLYTSFQVRQDSQSLYGFMKKEQKEVFEDIIQVSGVGPKVALGIISILSPSEFKNILLKGDYKTLSKVKGLGQKGAKKIVLELQGIYIENEEEIPEKDSEMFEELQDALEALGFQSRELKKLLKKAKDFYKENPRVSIEALISYVLKK